MIDGEKDEDDHFANIVLHNKNSRSNNGVVDHTNEYPTVIML
jgi:hypothetical protein